MIKDNELFEQNDKGYVDAKAFLLRIGKTEEATKLNRYVLVEYANKIKSQQVILHG